MTATNNNDNSNKKDKATPAASKQQKPAKKNTTVDDDQESQKKKIRPTDSIFNRIKWDISIPKDQVLIGYLDRFIGVIEVPFSKWKGVDEHEGVPLHRIRYYKLNGTIIWDREKKIDMLTGGDVSHLANRNIASSSSTPSASPSTRNGGSSSRSSQRTHYPFKQQIPYYSYNPESEEWEVIRTTSHTRSVKMSTLRVLTYNVLFDMHDADKIYTPKRVPHILNIIQDSDADIIALQEVRRSFLEELCREDWVRRNYFISDVSGDDTVQDSYGQVMLSKFEPNALYLHRFSSMKFALLPVFIILPDDSFVKEKLIIPIVHLSSDHVNHSTSKRAKQLVQLFQEVKLLEADHAIIMGDFNFSDGEAEDEILYNWGKDAWLSTHKIHKRPGYTFDPSTNICAAITTKKNISRRLDKVVFASQKLVPQHTELQGLDTISFLDEMTQKQVNLHPSDHYALQCDFIITNSQIDSVIDKLTRVHSSSLVVVPPRASWKRIQKIRNTFDPSAKRWPPHINLIYPFFEKNDLDLVKPLIENKVTSIEPFIIKLNSFEYDENGVVYLRPSTNNFELVKLQESLQKLFPTCHNMSMIDSNYVPRLEVATFSVEDVQSKVAELQSIWEPVEFLVDQIFVIDRDDTTFNVEYSAPLGMNPTLKIEDISTELNDFYVQHNLVENRDSVQQKRQALDYLESTILTHFSTSDSSSTLSQREYLLKTFGSYRLGIKSNDIDAVCICTSQNPAHSGEEFLESMKYIMCDDAERIASCRTILDAMVPMLNIKFVDGIEIDLLYIHIPVTLEDSDEAVGKLSRAQVKIISGLKECGCMLRYVPDRKLFQALISFVKFWAKQRGIYSNAYGYLGGISYAILCLCMQRVQELYQGDKLSVRSHQALLLHICKVEMATISVYHKP